MTFSSIGISICILAVILLNTFLIYKINKANDVTVIKLSSFWKMIVFILIIGMITVFLDLVKTYNSINPGADVREVTESIQLHILHGLFYLMIAFLTIANRKAVKYYRQSKYNKTNNDDN